MNLSILVTTVRDHLVEKLADYQLPVPGSDPLEMGPPRIFVGDIQPAAATATDPVIPYVMISPDNGTEEPRDGEDGDCTAEVNLWLAIHEPQEQPDSIDQTEAETLTLLGLIDRLKTIFESLPAGQLSARKKEGPGLTGSFDLDWIEWSWTEEETALFGQAKVVTYWRTTGYLKPEALETLEDVYGAGYAGAQES